jgi:hypothetical protein
MSYSRVGLGQACSVWDVLSGACQATDTFGQPCTVDDVIEGTCGETQAQGLQPVQCNALENWLFPGTCSSAQSAPTSPLTLALPGGGAPPATISPACPAGTSLAAGNCVQSGVDANGNPIYISTPSGPDLQAMNLAAIQAQAAATTPPDCSQWQNNWFNPACKCTYCQSALTWGGLGLAAFLLYGLLRGARVF